MTSQTSSSASMPGATPIPSENSAAIPTAQADLPEGVLSAKSEIARRLDPTAPAPLPGQAFAGGDHREICAILFEAILAMTASGVRVHVFPSAPVTPSLDVDILKLVAEQGSVAPIHLAARLKVSRSALQPSLARLLKAGQLVTQGKTRNRIYRLPLAQESAVA